MSTYLLAVAVLEDYDFVKRTTKKTDNVIEVSQVKDSLKDCSNSLKKKKSCEPPKKSSFKLFFSGNSNGSFHS